MILVDDLVASWLTDVACLSHAPLPISALLESMEQKRMSLNEDINTSLKNLAREIR